MSNQIMKMKNDYLLIQEIEPEVKSKGGLYLPKPKYNRKALVLSVGESQHIKKGDIVLRNLGKSTIYKINGETCETIHLNDIIMVIGNIKDTDATETKST